MKVENLTDQNLALETADFFLRDGNRRSYLTVSTDAAIQRLLNREPGFFGICRLQMDGATRDSTVEAMKKKTLTGPFIPAGTFREGFVYFEGASKKGFKGTVVEFVPLGLLPDPIPVNWR